MLRGVLVLGVLTAIGCAGGDLPEAGYDDLGLWDANWPRRDIGYPSFDATPPRRDAGIVPYDGAHPHRDAGYVPYDAEAPDAIVVGDAGLPIDAAFADGGTDAGPTRAICQGFEPSKTIVEDIVVDSPDDLAQLENAECVGNLFVRANGLVELVLTELRRVDGDLTIWGYPPGNGVDLTTVRLPALTSVTGSLILRTNLRLSAVEMPSLVSVKDGLVVEANRVLSTLRLPALEWIAGESSIGSNESLWSIELPALRSSLGSLRITSNAVLSSVHLPVLTWAANIMFIESSALVELSLPALVSVAGSLVMGQHHALTTLRLPQLTRVEQDAHIQLNDVLASVELPLLERASSLDLFRNLLLARVNFPMLVEASLAVAENPVLSALSLPLLEEVFVARVSDNATLATLQLPALGRVRHDAIFTDNPQLDECAVHDLLAQVNARQGVGGHVESSGNLGRCGSDPDPTEAPCADFAVEQRHPDPYLVTSPADLIGLQGIRCVGGLQLRADGLGDLSLPALLRVDGDLLLPGGEPWDQTDITRLSMPGLQAIRGDARFTNSPALTAIDLPVLTTVRGALAIEFNDRLSSVDLSALELGAEGVDVHVNALLTSLELGALKHVVRTLGISSNASLAHISLPLLQMTGSLFIGYNDVLSSLQLPRLESSAGQVSLSMLPALSGVVLPSLQRVAWGLEVKENQRIITISLPALTSPVVMDASSNRSLTEIHAPALVSSSLRIHDNPVLGTMGLPLLEQAFTVSVQNNRSLQTLELPALAQVRHDLQVESNARLPHCSAAQLEQQVKQARGIGGLCLIADNDDPCRPDPCSIGVCALSCEAALDYLCQ